MINEPSIDPRPRLVAGVLAAGAVASVAVASLLAFAVSGDARVAAFAALVCLVASLPAAAALLSPNPTVPSQHGPKVLIGTMGQTLGAVAIGALLMSAADLDSSLRRPYWLGIVAGAFPMLGAQVAGAMMVLRQAGPSAPVSAGTVNTGTVSTGDRTPPAQDR